MVITGRLRTETAPEDAPYDAEDLARNFERVALYHEVDPVLPTTENNRNSNSLARWERPIRYYFLGDAVTPEDRVEVARLMERIVRLTGLEAAETKDDFNFLILISTPGERAAYRRSLAEVHPDFANTFELWRRTPTVVCVANNLFSADDGNFIVRALVVIGSETSGLLRKGCLHEMIVKVLGLSNGHPEVRPSIFNDDGEFALLTEHDEHLLRILYDPRLEPGISAAEAMPIVRQIAAEIAPAVLAVN